MIGTRSRARYAIGEARSTGSSITGSLGAPGLLPFRLGAFRAAVSARRPVVPITLAGTRDIFPADTILLRPGTVTLTVHPPQPPTADTFEEVVRLRDNARRLISQDVGEQAG